MILNETEQLKKTLEDKKNILITFQPNGGDAPASAVALSLFLEKLGKQVDMVANNFSLSTSFKFLKKTAEIKSNFDYLQKFIVTIDVKNTGVQELSYDLKDEKLRIFITPKNGFLSSEHVRTAQSDFKYDLIFVLDTPDLASLGALYDNNTELFYKRPIINIDHTTINEHFGQFNLIDLTATSTAEVVYNLINGIAPELINEEIATALLTGMIAKTRSFKEGNIKPHTLQIASKLIGLGGQREHIVQNLYQTKSISTLKLWGIALSHLQQDTSLGLAWTTITRDDFIRSGAEAPDLYEIVDELLSTSPEVKLFTLFHEQSDGGEFPRIHVILDAGKNQDAKLLLTPFGLASGDKKQATTIIAGKSLKEVETEIIEHIKKTVI